MNELSHYISDFFGVSQDDLDIVNQFFRPATLEKGNFFLKTGRLADRLGFIQTGIIREYLVIEDKEVTKWISTAGYFVVDLASFLFDKPARCNIQALTDCEMFCIDRSDYKKLNELLPRWPMLEKLFIAKCFSILEDRVVQHISLSAEERYQKLLQFNPSLFNTVPLQYIASMLGMTAETLSRLRKKSLKNSS